MNYRFLAPAKSELVEAVEFYEEAVPGLGLEFLDEVERTIARIDLQPEAWNPISENQRRCRMRRFPFGLIYSIDDGEIVISALMHFRRHPDSCKDRI
ncbi:MAG: type II toxin-antitoxin system RelE/ParE family toxin [Opitutae bacterium]|nr:type II toxin-antitoxin system RelE/ParE family toxin [Opitutae bacterium]